MPVRKIIEIDEEKCDGCGQCVVACAEGALEIIDGKAKVVSEVFCDGLGACIGDCPNDALRIVEREAPEFDEAAVEDHLGKKIAHEQGGANSAPCACPSAAPFTIRASSRAEAVASACEEVEDRPHPELTNWPVQWKLIQPDSPFFRGADIVISADCVPFAHADFHRAFLPGKPLVIGCPKLDEQEAFLQKLTALFQGALPKSVRIVIMEVPCCGGLVRMVEEARNRAGGIFPVSVTTVGIKGEILEERVLHE